MKSVTFKNEKDESSDEERKMVKMPNTFAEDEISDKTKCLEHLNNLFERRVRQFKRLQKAVKDF